MVTQDIVHAKVPRNRGPKGVAARRSEAAGLLRELPREEAGRLRDTFLRYAQDAIYLDFACPAPWRNPGRCL